jgi:hypothetical protein
MHEDRTLFGDGRYPDSGPMAIIARLGFLTAGLAIVVAVFLPSQMVPDFVRSHYLQHFAAFYVLALAGMAAMPRGRLRSIGLGFFVFATLLEGLHLLSGASLGPLIDNWVADLGGVSAAMAPVVIERFRRRFPRPPRETP